MLDALLAEARIRWGLDPAQGLQVVAIERLIATPLDPTRPAVLATAAVLGSVSPAASSASTAADVAEDRAADAASPAPYAHCPAATDRTAATRSPCSVACTRPTIPSAGSVSRRAPRSAR